jgi:hypothetical protein
MGLYHDMKIIFLAGMDSSKPQYEFMLIYEFLICAFDKKAAWFRSKHIEDTHVTIVGGLKQNYRPFKNLADFSLVKFFSCRTLLPNGLLLQ